MQRKDFIKQGSLALLGVSVVPKQHVFSKKRKKIPPKPLLKGGTVALLAPGSPTSESNFERGIENLTTLGYKVKVMPHARAQNGYLAGTDTQRLEDLHEAFWDKSVDAVWCLRGGYGCGRLLQDVDFKLIRKNPKIFVGYSDITALHTAIHQCTGLVTFHGPMATSDFTPNNIRNLKTVVEAGMEQHLIETPHEDDLLRGEEYRPEGIRHGTATGDLIGGNLSLLAALCGTEFQPEFKDKIVFIEDVGEKPYRLDRMFTQLLQATDLKKAAGIALGVFADCNPGVDDRSLTLREMLHDRLGDLGLPVLYGLPFGHIPEQATIPIGVRARLDTKTMDLRFLEKAVRF